MKPELYEISDDEWENHSFKPSRVLKRPRSSPSPPPIESFAFTSNNRHKAEVSVSSDDDGDDCVEITQHSASFPESLDDLEDADVNDGKGGGGGHAAASRGRRFIIDDDDEEEHDGGDRNGGAVELYDVGSSEEEVDESDVVGRALQKCARISVELKGELYGSSGTACERYSEVESSSVRIVTQVWWCCFARENGDS